jgi:hypothetical protein
MIRIIALILMSLILTACGGGGGNGELPTVPQEPIEIVPEDPIKPVATVAIGDNLWQLNDDPTPSNWADSLSYCEELDLDGYTDWRLPSVNELSTLTSYSNSTPALK